MKLLKIWPYKIGSAGAKALATILDCKRVKSDGKYRPKVTHKIINWGNTEFGNWEYPRILNHPKFVKTACNKLEALKVLEDADINIPPFAIDHVGASKLFDLSRRVYCRQLLRGNCGRGIVVADNPDALVDAPLYTAGIDGFRDEYRVHVFNGEVIDYQMKKRKKEVDNDTTIRNHDNGWVFCRMDVTITDGIRNIAVEAVAALGLDFGAVDIIVRRKCGTPYVLEVNTAPGLEGTTLDRYLEAITEWYEDANQF